MLAQSNAMERKHILWLKGTAGLGNRLLAYAAGITYARITGRSLFVDWRDGVYSDGIRNVFYDAFNPVGVDCVSTADEYATDVFPTRWIGNLENSKKCLRGHNHEQTTVDFGDYDRAEQTVVAWSYNDQWGKLRHVFTGMDRTQALRATLEHLGLKAAMQDELHSLARHTEIEKCHAAIAYRDSDIEAVTSIEECCNKVEKLTNGLVFMATDSRLALNFAASRFGNRLRHIPKWYPPDGEKMHGNNNCPDRFANFKNAVLELHLLSQCETLFITRVLHKCKQSRSSFYYIAEVLPRSKIENTIII